MPREIKFRAWLKDENKYFYWIPEFFSDQSPVMGYGDSIDYESIELEQYTGLKDKNGVEIYEGDIITRSAYNKYVGLVVFKHVSFVVQVEVNRFREKYMYLDFKDDDYNDGKVSATFETKTEVIGSIHENPELITTYLYR